ncbi:hypothetical protein E8E12_002998 [Didymella heteroderae]|uniref:Uncharacterized protein n=1 Tax=Didymella heteroderae TaxID=1769908 RepID=A0A9P4WGP5_9PLEO|nr:hypothetical protein E8E12_002998 [Didymella heteroderae]
MLNNISTYLQTQESELCKLKDTLIELETTLISERDNAREVARNQRQKLVRERAELGSYVSAITNQALDITTGICNISGKQIPKADKIYVMQRCGAPVCPEVAEANTLSCPIHPSEGIQKVHAVYSRECGLYNGNDPKKLIDTNCGEYSSA